MSNFSDFFPAAGGGGGGIPKYEEFTSSGTFTPSQALIDAGGRISYIIVGGGGRSDSASYGGNGGYVKVGYQTLTSTSGCAVTIGAAATGQNTDGGSSSVAFSSAGGTDETANGGYRNYNAAYGAVWAGYSNHGSASNGILNYGVGGASNQGIGSTGYSATNKNYGSGSKYTNAAGAGFVRIMWFE